MQPLDILFLALAALAVISMWAVVELAFTMRKARATLDEVSHSATEAIDQATPIIAKLDGVVDELQPALREVTPLVEQAGTTLEEANQSLVKINGILGDVSSATHGVAGVGESATRIVNTATSAAVGVVSKVASLGGITIPEGQQLIGKGDPTPAEQEAQAAPVQEAPHKGGYVTYQPVTVPVDEQTTEE